MTETKTIEVVPAKRDGLWHAICHRCGWTNRGLKQARAESAAYQHSLRCKTPPAGTPCPCPCHAVVQPGLVPCPQCEPR